MRALPAGVHDWDDAYSVSVFRPASDGERKLGFKQRAVGELVATLSRWAASKNTFEEVNAEGSFGCKVFSMSITEGLFDWLDGVKSH